jgi:hypothetical protein
VLALGSAACSDIVNGIGGYNAEGSYNLMTFNGSQLPTVVYDDGFEQRQVLQETFTIYNDGTYTDDYTLRISDRTGSSQQSFRDTGRTQIDPAHNPCNILVALRQLEQKSCFFFGLVGLNNNGSVNAVRLALGKQVLWKEIALQNGHRVRDPSIPEGVIFPEVLVRIDLHYQVNPFSNARRFSEPALATPFGT